MTATVHPIDDAERDVLQPDDGPDDAALADSTWRVTDERSAEYALLRIRVARHDTAKRTEAAREMLAEHEARATDLRAWIAKQEEQADGTISHFEALLTAWHRARFAEDPKGCVSISLAGGVLKSRSGSVTVTITDGEAVVRAAEEAGEEFAARVPKVWKDRIKAYIKATGMAVDGATIHKPTDDDRTFRVEVPDA